MRKRARLISMAVAAAIGLGALGVDAVTCSVPTASYPTIQSAIAAPSCTEIAVAAGSYPESPVIARDLGLRGVASVLTVIQGQVQVQAGAVVLENLGIETETGLFADALKVSSGAEVSGVDLVVVNGGARIGILFEANFETGNLSQWS